MKIQFNEREFKRLMQTEVQNGVEKMAAQQTRDLERLRQQYTGRPVAEIKPALQQLFSSYNGKVSEYPIPNGPSSEGVEYFSVVFFPSQVWCHTFFHSLSELLHDEIETSYES